MDISFAVKDGTGVDPILEAVGLEKPEGWNYWTQTQKFNYLQERGIDPLYGRKYQGKADVSGFFDWLGVDKPADWESRTFDEKKKFVDSVLSGTESEPEKSVTDNVYVFIRPIITVLSLFLVISSFFRKRSSMNNIGRIVSLYVLPIILVLIAILVPDKTYFVHMGDWAERILIFLLFVKPVSVVFKSRFFARAVLFRQELGLASFYLFIIHAFGLMFVENFGINELTSVDYLVWGILAGILMIILGVTSNKLSMKLLKKNWKRLQYGAYVALFATLLHTSIIRKDMRLFYIIFGAFSILKYLE